nr:MAG TPA: hypothetical protein [Caudoviricetes sp.]
MNVTAECINSNIPVQYGYIPVKTRNLYSPSLEYILYQGVPYYLGSLCSMYIDIDFPDFMNYDAIIVMDDVYIRQNNTLIFNSLLLHPIRFIAECLSIPLILCTRKLQYSFLKQNETDLFKVVTSHNSLKKALKHFKLSSDSNVYAVNAYRSADFNYPEIMHHTARTLEYLKEY